MMRINMYVDFKTVLVKVMLTVAVRFRSESSDERVCLFRAYMREFWLYPNLRFYEPPDSY